MIVRKFTIKDREAYKLINLEALREEPLAFSGSYEESLTLTDDERKQRSTPSKVITFGVFENSQAIAMGWWKSSWRKKTNHVANMRWVYVACVARRQWVASMLFDVIFTDIKAHNYISKISLTVYVNQVAALSFYKQHWFLEVGRLKWELLYDWKYYDSIMMEYYL